VLLIVLAIASIGLRWSVLGVVGSLVLLVIGTGAFASMSMLIAAGVKTRERFMGIGQLIMMPLFFASSALYPLTIMPGWLRAVARVNPLTYEVQGLRQMLLGVGAREWCGSISWSSSASSWPWSPPRPRHTRGRSCRRYARQLR
jgi:ABC-2 type transport system permease protein